MPSPFFRYVVEYVAAMFSSASMWPTVRFSSRAAVRTEAIEERSSDGRDRARTCALSFPSATTVAEPMAPVAVVTTEMEDSLRLIKEHHPEIRVGLTTQRVEPNNADFIALDQRNASDDALASAERYGIKVWVWTVDDKKLMQRFVNDNRVEGLITNRPEEALKLRSARS